MSPPPPPRPPAGKTTLLKLLTGALEPSTGYVRRNPRMRAGIYNQHFVDRLPMDIDPTSYLKSKVRLCVLHVLYAVYVLDVLSVLYALYVLDVLDVILYGLTSTYVDPYPPRCVVCVVWVVGYCVCCWMC